MEPRTIWPALGVVVGVVASFGAVDASFSADEASVPAAEVDASSVVDSSFAVEVSSPADVCVRVERVAAEVVAAADVAVDKSTAVAVGGLDSLDSVSAGRVLVPTSVSDTTSTSLVGSAEVKPWVAEAFQHER